MHHIYHTEGVILGSRDVGESSRRLSIFTRELGLVHARASGVRKMSSKLRFVLVDFACVKADLVQGKNSWRVTSASYTGKLDLLGKKPEALRVFVRISALLLRLLPASERSEKLFADLLRGLELLENSKTQTDIENTEILVVLRILADLGYIGGGDAIENFVRSPLEEELVYKISPARRHILRHINQALRASHL